MSETSNIIKFSTNWNNKLESKNFTTLRMSLKYTNKPHVLIEFKGKYKVAKIIDVRKISIWKLNEWNCRLDTGYSLKETLDILGKMYNFDPIRQDRTIYIYLIETCSDWITLPECHDIIG